MFQTDSMMVDWAVFVEFCVSLQTQWQTIRKSIRLSLVSTLCECMGDDYSVYSSCQQCNGMMTR